MHKLNPSDFHAALAEAGFSLLKGGAYCDTDQVRGLCSAEIVRVSGLAYVAVGLWIRQIGHTAPHSYNHCHIYGSLGSVIPKYAGLKVASGEADEAAWSELIEKTDEIVNDISKLLSIEALRRGMKDGAFKKCLVRKEVRAFLQ